jgi:hypothetical protein
MFMQMRRTNNHVEGFHNSLRVLVNSNSPNLVKFIGIVRSEAESIALQAKLLSQNEALSNLRKDTLEMQHCLSTFWQDYNDQRIGSEKLLQLCAVLFAKHNRNKFRALIDDQVWGRNVRVRNEGIPKQNTIFLCNGWTKFFERRTSEKEIHFSFRITVILFNLLSVSEDTIKNVKMYFFRSFLVVYLATDGCTI